jgi:hypothetical protein
MAPVNAEKRLNPTAELNPQPNVNSGADGSLDGETLPASRPRNPLMQVVASTGTTGQSLLDPGHHRWPERGEAGLPGLGR